MDQEMLTSQEMIATRRHRPEPTRSFTTQAGSRYSYAQEGLTKVFQAFKVMQPHHLLLLVLDLGAVVCLVAGLFFLLRRGFHAATLGTYPPNADGLVQWNESLNSARSRISIARQMLKHLARALQFKVQANGSLMIAGSMIADPVDGTAFQEGETIVRCACGTNYHQSSWQWLGEKNEGKCVNCRRPGLISTCTAS